MQPCMTLPQVFRLNLWSIPQKFPNSFCFSLAIDVGREAPLFLWIKRGFTRFVDDKRRKLFSVHPRSRNPNKMNFTIHSSGRLLLSNWAFSKARPGQKVQTHQRFICCTSHTFLKLFLKWSFSKRPSFLW